MKALSEVMAKLAERYDGPISQREGAGGRSFSYIPWTETVRRLNEVFGIFGWSTTTPVVMLADGVYTVSLALVARVLDDETGSVIEKTVAGVGSAVSRGANDDNASKSALSDAISRAAKLLGDQFGFFLYEEKGAAPAAKAAYSANSNAARSSEAPRQAAAGDRRPSEKQMKILTGDKLGFTAAEVAEMDFKTWKGHLDAFFAEMNGGF